MLSSLNAWISSDPVRARNHNLFSFQATQATSAPPTPPMQLVIVTEMRADGFHIFWTDFSAN